MVLTKKRQMFLLGLAFLVGTLAIAWLQQSAVWLIGTAVSALVMLVNMKSLPARKTTLFGADLLLFETPLGAPFARCFDDVHHYIDRESPSNSKGPRSARKGQPAALIGPFRGMADIADRAVYLSGLHPSTAEMREVDYIGQLTVYCNGCKTPMSSAFKSAALAEAKIKGLAGADFLTMSAVEAEDGGAIPTHDGRCPRCNDENALYVWGAA
jgi:hypothetical protein